MRFRCRCHHPANGSLVASDQQVLLAAAAANAAIVRMTALPTVLVVRPDDNDGLRQLRKAGAWLTLDPQAIGACATD